MVEWDFPIPRNGCESEAVNKIPRAYVRGCATFALPSATVAKLCCYGAAK